MAGIKAAGQQGWHIFEVAGPAVKLPAWRADGTLDATFVCKSADRGPKFISTTEILYEAYRLVI